MTQKVYFIVDGSVQYSIFNPWKNSFERAGYEVIVLNCEHHILNQLNIAKYGWLQQIYQWSRRSAHKRIMQTVMVMFFTPIRLYLVKNLSKWIIHTVSDNLNAIVFTFKGLDIRPEVIRSLTSRGTFTICLNGDSLFNMYSSNEDVIRCAKEYSLFLAWSPAMLNEVEVAGVKNSFYLPFAYEKNEGQCLNLIDVPLLEKSLVFIGVWDEERERDIYTLGMSNIVVFGPNWNRASREFLSQINVVSKRLTPGEMSYIYENCLAALNLMRLQNAGSHNMKSFEMPGSGAISIMPNTVFHKKTFAEYGSIRLYDNIAEVPEIVRDIEKIEIKIRKKMCAATKQFILANHSYDARFSQVLSFIKQGGFKYELQNVLTKHETL